MITNLIAEIARAYYELITLDNQLQIVKESIKIQSDALRTITLEKQGARATELALKRFQAQVLNTQSLQCGIEQTIIQTEREISYLLGNFPQPVIRKSGNLSLQLASKLDIGVPSNLLKSRPDIRKAELELAASELDIGVARAEFYPSLRITADVGYQAYKLQKVLQSPDSLIYSLAGDLFAPLLNRKVLEAELLNAGAKQKKAVLEYERTVLNAFIEVSNQLSNLKNLNKSHTLKSKQVKALTDSVDIANLLFRSARADYTEVLFTQREALQSRFELTKLELKRMHTAVNLYRSLGGGWSKNGASL
jgi:outer membrane protein, multidrug efflux system